MIVKLVVISGPHSGKEFAFEEHDTFLVGRAREAHLRLSYDDPYFSRRHFLVEVNPPRVRAFDLNSRNGISVNGAKIHVSDLKDGDELRAGHTVFRVVVQQPAEAPADETGGHLQETGTCLPPPATVCDTVSRTAGVLIPGYRVEHLLGRGAMGAVYRAVRLHDGQAVAVKVVAPASGASPRQVLKFLREAQILASLNHANIVRHVESGERTGVIYLVMELVDGTDAAALVRLNGPLPAAAAVQLALQALAGLSHAHAQGIVHRDVKPSNLLVGEGPGARVLKVADFGLARAYDACGLSGLTLQGEMAGTPAFMAPEQATHFRDAKPAADQYAAAASLYYLLTGKYVLDFAHQARTSVVQIITEPRVPLRARRPDLPLGLARVVDRALEVDAGDRFADVLEFRDALLPFANPES